jgi:hypothetical protein
LADEVPSDAGDNGGGDHVGGCCGRNAVEWHWRSHFVLRGRFRLCW